MALKLIVPLDMSHVAERALPLARTLAGQLAAEVVLISVVEVSSDLDDFVSTKEYKEDIVRLERDLSQYLDGVAATFENMPVETLIRIGSAVDEIATLAGSFDEAALVICSHGRSGIRRHLIGSVAMRLIHEISCPAFVVTAGSGATPFEGPVRDVLVPLDGSDMSETAIHMVTGLFGKESIELHIVRVSELGAWRTMPYATLDYYGDDRYFTAAEQAVRTYLTDTLRRLESSGHSVSVQTRSGPVTEQILTAAEESASDIIAMATHGRTGIDRLIMGSEAERVVRESQIPVLLQRPAIVAARR
jgi:nucleotide-binding universal stress UspA family protein